MCHLLILCPIAANGVSTYLDPIDESKHVDKNGGFDAYIFLFLGRNAPFEGSMA